MLSTMLRGFSIAKRYSHQMPRKPFEEISIPVPWGEIAGKWWGSTERQPILCLHGAQDNCGSFEPLVTYLDKYDEYSFLAIDFPGHGFSSPFPAGNFYHFLNYPIVVKRICDYLKWSQVSLMGHCLGAISAFTFSMLYPEKVKCLICIDALQPYKTTVSAETLRQNIDHFVKCDNLKMSEEESSAHELGEAVNEMIEYYGKVVRYEQIPFLLERNLVPSKEKPGEFQISRDPKLKMKVMCDWPQNQIIKDASVLTMPIFVCKAKNHRYYGPEKDFFEVLEKLRNTSVNLHSCYLNGTHYLHLNEPEYIGEYIKKFLDDHDKPVKIEMRNISPFFRESRPVLDISVHYRSEEQDEPFEYPTKFWTNQTYNKILRKKVRVC